MLKEKKIIIIKDTYNILPKMSIKKKIHVFLTSSYKLIKVEDFGETKTKFTGLSVNEVPAFIIWNSNKFLPN